MEKNSLTKIIAVMIIMMGWIKSQTSNPINYAWISLYMDMGNLSLTKAVDLNNISLPCHPVQNGAL